jgi:hypothetical protein
MKKTDENEERMYLLYKKMEKSGLSQKKFCLGEKVPYSTFGYWVKKFGNKNTGFAEIKVSAKEITPSVASPTEFTLEFPSGTKLTFKDLVDPTWIKSIV